MEHLKQKIKNTKKTTSKLPRTFINDILNIVQRSGPRAPDPETGSTPLKYNYNNTSTIILNLSDHPAPDTFFFTSPIKYPDISNIHCKYFRSLLAL